MKVYEVIVIDVWNNVYRLGLYKNLNDSLSDINSYISSDKLKLEEGDLKEYPSTFNSCFDLIIGDVAISKGNISEEELDDFYEDSQLQVRGFIFDSEYLKEELNNLGE